MGCDYFFQNPSFELVDVEAFDEDLSIAANTENLVKNIDAWLNSHSCVGIYGEYQETLKNAIRSLQELTAIAEDPDNDVADLVFTVVEEEKDYYAAMASCYLQDKRLAVPESQQKIDMLAN